MLSNHPLSTPKIFHLWEAHFPQQQKEVQTSNRQLQNVLKQRKIGCAVQMTQTEEENSKISITRLFC